MTRSTGFKAFVLAGVAALAITGCHSHTTIVEPTRTVEQPVAVPVPDHHDDHHDDHRPPSPPPRHDDHR